MQVSPFARYGKRIVRRDCTCCGISREDGEFSNSLAQWCNEFACQEDRKKVLYERLKIAVTKNNRKLSRKRKLEPTVSS